MKSKYTYPANPQFSELGSVPPRPDSATAAMNQASEDLTPGQYIRYLKRMRNEIDCRLRVLET